MSAAHRGMHRDASFAEKFIVRNGRRVVSLADTFASWLGGRKLYATYILVVVPSNWYIGHFLRQS